MSQPSLPPHHQPSHRPPQPRGVLRAPSRGWRSKPALKLIAGGVLAATLVTGCGSGDDDDGGNGGSSSKGAQAKTLGKVAMPKVGKEANTMGTWVTDSAFVKGDVNKLVGYSLDGAKAKWRIPLGGQLCWASPHMTKDGLTAILFRDGAGEDALCTKVGLVDLKKGELVWQKEESDSEGNAGVRFDEVTIGGGTVAAGGTGGGGAWSLDGKPLWKPAYLADCDDDGYAGGDDKIVAIRGCDTRDSSTKRLEVQTVDPRTRDVKSSYKLDEKVEYAHVISTAPLVVAVDTGDSDAGTGTTDILTIDDSAEQGKLLSTIDVLAKGYQPNCPATSVEGCTELALDKASSTLYLSSEVDVDQGGPGDRITGLNLKTGKETGKTKMAENRSLIPIRTDDDGSLLAYLGSTYSEAGGVVRVDAKDFAMDTLQTHPDDMKDAESGMDIYGDCTMIYTGKKLYIGDSKATRPTSGDGAGRPLAIVYGS
ncbi:PQQ-binding-like beta-propeller repeat protein [Streptomyces rugosispiralis]|uniref:PQQ-binding-like beta-propeller repeat protein n=1 Tax=Streptomyces rugosispiralis TaxID=2967341 RepID=A0ABT1UWJ5_9ACTN|nr:PQQ-binding-like beta-propeller repeat protein [Streptomyces rugosispiralis]MCQ8189497.1 PQQ-binding-like beta-propeller repeat protein [Streptomyces rugosispiralis]